MSYSFSIVASSKEEAVLQLEPKFDEVVASQPVHTADKELAIKNATLVIGMLEDPDETQNVSVSVSGWLSWRSENEFVGASASCSANLVNK